MDSVQRSRPVRSQVHSRWELYRRHSSTQTGSKGVDVVLQQRLRKSPSSGDPVLVITANLPKAHHVPTRPPTAASTKAWAHTRQRQRRSYSSNLFWNAALRTASGGQSHQFLDRPCQVRHEPSDVRALPWWCADSSFSAPVPSSRLQRTSHLSARRFRAVPRWTLQFLNGETVDGVTRLNVLLLSPGTARCCDHANAGVKFDAGSSKAAMTGWMCRRQRLIG